MALIALCACDREPGDPFDAFIWQFERKAEALFAHLENADELTELEAGAVTDRGMLREDVEVYRYTLVPAAANEVFEHFAQPPLTLLRALSSEPADPDWVRRLQESVASRRITLEQRVETFKATMPEDPPIPEQEGPVGALMIGGCSPGNIFSSSDACKVGQYAYSDEGELYFFVWRRQLQQLMAERALDLDVDDWVRSVERAARELNQAPD